MLQYSSDIISWDANVCKLNTLRVTVDPEPVAAVIGMKQESWIALSTQTHCIYKPYAWTFEVALKMDIFSNSDFLNAFEVKK